MKNELALLGPELLSEERELVEAFAELAGELGIQLGWHYLLDLAWIASQLGDVSTLRVLDAGAGTGVLQWWLAQQGAKVVSVDRQDRSDLSFRYRMAYRVRGLRSEDLDPPRRMVMRRLRHDPGGLGMRMAAALRAALGGFLTAIRAKAPGEVVLYNHDLCPLPDLHSEQYDAVVSVSALEHNDPQDLRLVVQELLRVLKPGGVLLATMAAAVDQDWYHAPSQGWCLTEASLRKAFGFEQAPLKQDFGDYEATLEALRGSPELEQRLAPFHFDSGDSGMPWGKWDPQYVPVGIKLIKEHSTDTLEERNSS